MIIWIIFLLLAHVYFAFKIGRIYDPTQTAKYIGSGKFLTLFGMLFCFCFFLAPFLQFDQRSLLSLSLPLAFIFSPSPFLPLFPLILLITVISSSLFFFSPFFPLFSPFIASQPLSVWLC